MNIRMNGWTSSFLRKWCIWRQVYFSSLGHPLHPERKQACYSLFSGCTRSKLLLTQEQQGSSPNEELSHAKDSWGCTPDRWHHHGHKPERRGFCMMAHGNLCEPSMSWPKLWAHPSLPWEWWRNHYHLSLLGARFPPCVTANLYMASTVLLGVSLTFIRFPITCKNEKCLLQIVQICQWFHEKPEQCCYKNC